MSGNSLIVVAAGTCCGVIFGWILGSQSAARDAPPVVFGQPAVTSTATPTSTAGATAPTPLDTQRASDLEREANAEPGNAVVRTQLGNLYYDADRFDLAIPWYQAALDLDSRDVSVSTDLAVSFYSLDQVDRALAQLDVSLAIDPGHLSTLLNQGIIRAFGKQDLTGAAAAWERVVALAPDSEEGQRARQGLDGIRSAHGGTVPASGS